MTFKKIFFLTLILMLGRFYNYGQQINYSNSISYNPSNTIFKVAGKVGNNIHIWKFLLYPNTTDKEESPISVLIFSDQMKLISETPVKMMDETISGVDEYFQVEGNIYYAYIKYFTAEDMVKRQVFKIDESGNVININPYVDAPESPGPSYVSEKFPYVRNNRTEYYASTGSLISDSDSIGKNKSPELKKMVVYKKGLTAGKASSQIEYSSAIFDFTNPRVALDKDNTIWVCASNKPDFKKKHSDSSTLYSLFLTKFDSNLHEISVNEKFLKINEPDIPHRTFYRVENIFATNKNLFLLSLGNQLTTSYSDNTSIFNRLPGQRNLPPVREEHQSYEIKSLRILQIDNAGNRIKDTIISTKLFKAKLHTDNSFYSLNTDGIDLFYLQEFPRQFNGIMHISVSTDGIILNDMPVNLNYNYILQNATKVDEKTFIIPFSDQVNIGFMKCKF